jgi:hypothetical protein
MLMLLLFLPLLLLLLLLLKCDVLALASLALRWGSWSESGAAARDGVNLELGTELSDSDLRKVNECNGDLSPTDDNFRTTTRPANG